MILDKYPEFGSQSSGSKVKVVNKRKYSNKSRIG